MLPVVYCQRVMMGELPPSELPLAKHEPFNVVEGLENKNVCRDSGQCQPCEVDPV